MSLKAKRKRNMGIMIICLILIAIVFIYPVYLMFMNSFKPFGEIVADVLAFPKHFDLSNYTYVIKKMDYALLFRNNVIITVIGIAGIVVFSSMAAYMLDRKDCICNHYNTNADSVSDNYDHTVKIHECTASVRQQDRTGYPVLGIWNSDGNLYFL